MCIQRRQVHSLNRLVQRGQLLSIARRQRRNQQRRRQKLLPQVFRIRPALLEFNVQRSPPKILRVHGVQQLHRHRHFVARLGLVKQDDRLQVVAHGHAPPVEVENLRHRPIGFSVELEPDARARQVISVQRLRHLISLAKPHCLIGRLAPRRDDLPAALIQANRLAVRQVAGMELPNPVRQFVQTAEPFDHSAGLRRQAGSNLGGAASVLSRKPVRAGKQKRPGEHKQKNRNTETRLHNRNHGRAIPRSIVSHLNAFR